MAGFDEVRCALPGCGSIIPLGCTGGTLCPPSGGHTPVVFPRGRTKGKSEWQSSVLQPFAWSIGRWKKVSTAVALSLAPCAGLYGGRGPISLSPTPDSVLLEPRGREDPKEPQPYWSTPPVARVGLFEVASFVVRDLGWRQPRTGNPAQQQQQRTLAV